MFLLQRMCNSYLSIRFVTLQNIPIENLSRGRPQDNLEFLQFLKNLYDKLYEERDYDPIKRRQYSKGGKGMLFSFVSTQISTFRSVTGSFAKMSRYSVPVAAPSVLRPFLSAQSVLRRWRHLHQRRNATERCASANPWSKSMIWSTRCAC